MTIFFITYIVIIKVIGFHIIISIISNIIVSTFGTLKFGLGTSLLVIIYIYLLYSSKPYIVHHTAI